MSEVSVFLGMLFAMFVTYRVCRACWARTKHYRIDSYDDEVIVKCSECGYSYREKKNE